MRKCKIIPVDEAWNLRCIHDLFDVKRQQRTATDPDTKWHLDMIEHHAFTSLPVDAQVEVVIIGDERRA